MTIPPAEVSFRKVVSMNVPGRNCPDDDRAPGTGSWNTTVGAGPADDAPRRGVYVMRPYVAAISERVFLRNNLRKILPSSNQLQSSKPQWQRKLVRKLIGGGERFPWLKLVPAAAMLAAIIFAVIRGPALVSDFKVKTGAKRRGGGFRRAPDISIALTVRRLCAVQPVSRSTGRRNAAAAWMKCRPRSTKPAAPPIKIFMLQTRILAGCRFQGRALLWESTPSSLGKSPRKTLKKPRSAGTGEPPAWKLIWPPATLNVTAGPSIPTLQRTLNLLSRSPEQTRPEQGRSRYKRPV